MRRSILARPPTLLLAALALAPACRGTGRLAEYDFRERTLAVAYDAPPRADVRTGPYFPDLGSDPLGAIARAGSRVLKEIEANRLEPRLDSAAARVDVVARMADRTLERAARHMRARPVPGEGDADYLIEVRLRDYGIEAKDWNAAAQFYVDAEVFLIGARDGIQIWKSRVRERDPIAPEIFGPGTVIRDVVTAAVLAGLSVDEIALALERLADYSADRITGRLRDALEKVQRGGRPQ